ncbi:hypothetical protein HDU96_001042 [Phlyctochytrium bullatum]|nr:hypothetical protein HDU96_001042 [Phlyctochytrium bullatum]
MLPFINRPPAPQLQFPSLLLPGLGNTPGFENLTSFHCTNNCIYGDTVLLSTSALPPLLNVLDISNNPNITGTWPSPEFFSVTRINVTGSGLCCPDQIPAKNIVCTGATRSCLGGIVIPQQTETISATSGTDSLSATATSATVGNQDITVGGDSATSTPRSMGSSKATTLSGIKTTDSMASSSGSDSSGPLSNSAMAAVISIVLVFVLVVSSVGLFLMWRRKSFAGGMVDDGAGKGDVPPAAAQGTQRDSPASTGPTIVDTAASLPSVQVAASNGSRHGLGGSRSAPTSLFPDLDEEGEGPDEHFLVVTNGHTTNHEALPSVFGAVSAAAMARNGPVGRKPGINGSPPLPTRELPHLAAGSRGSGYEPLPVPLPAGKEGEWQLARNDPSNPGGVATAASLGVYQNAYTRIPSWRQYSPHPRQPPPPNLHIQSLKRSAMEPPRQFLRTAQATQPVAAAAERFTHGPSPLRSSTLAMGPVRDHAEEAMAPLIEHAFGTPAEAINQQHTLHDHHHPPGSNLHSLEVIAEEREGEASSTSGSFKDAASQGSLSSSGSVLMEVAGKDLVGAA